MSDGIEGGEFLSDVVVIDIGTSLMKAGWAGEDAPRVVFPTVFLDTAADKGDPSLDREIMNYLVGYKALKAVQKQVGTSSRKQSQLVRPVDRGVVKDWEALEKILDHIFKVDLNVDPSQYPVLVTCPPLSSHESKDRLARVMFRHLKVHSLAIVSSAPLALFSTGRTTGVVVEAGGGVCQVVPIFEGFALPHANLRLQVAGQDITRHLLGMLKTRGFDNFDDESSFDVVRDIKEKLCAVKNGEDVLEEKTDEEEQTSDDNTYELPDGRVISITEKERNTVAEILFEPQLAVGADKSEKDYPPLHKMLYKSIQMCDSYLQRDLFRNVVLAGGTSMLKGFGERMRNELTKLSSGHQYMNVIQDSQRKYAAWIGGSMFASLSTFQQIKISSAEYLADATVVHKRNL